MLRQTKLKIVSFLVLGIIISWGRYTIVIGQTPKPVLVVLNKADNMLAFLDPADMKVLGKVPTGESRTRSLSRRTEKTAFVANYGTQPATRYPLSISRR